MRKDNLINEKGISLFIDGEIQSIRVYVLKKKGIVGIFSCCVSIVLVYLPVCLSLCLPYSSPFPFTCREPGVPAFWFPPTPAAQVQCDPVYLGLRADKITLVQGKLHIHIPETRAPSWELPSHSNLKALPIRQSSLGAPVVLLARMTDSNVKKRV